jgi:hypothetical protein
MNTTNTNNKIKLNMDSLKSSKEWVRHRVKNGSNIYRILRPFGDSSNGYPYRRWQIIWGLVDPSSGRVRPYASSLMNEKRDPVVEFLEPLKERLSQMEGDLKARGFDDKALAKHLKFARLTQFVRDVSPKTSFIYNAADKAGVVGLLELKSTAHKKMKACMNDYIRDYNQDPTSLNSADDDAGVWFNVKRSGEGFTSTEYDVEKVQNKVKDSSGKVSFVDDRSPLQDVIVENYESMAYDLSSVYKTNTYDEINEILQANLDAFYAVCPESNMSVPVNLDEDSEVALPPSLVKTAGPFKGQEAKSDKVALNLRDDEDVDVPKMSKKSTSLPALSDDDSFMAAADAILRG